MKVLSNHKVKNKRDNGFSPKNTQNTLKSIIHSKRPKQKRLPPPKNNFRV